MAGRWLTGRTGLATPNRLAPAGPNAGSRVARAVAFVPRPADELAHRARRRAGANSVRSPANQRGAGSRTAFAPLRAIVVRHGRLDEAEGSASGASVLTVGDPDYANTGRGSPALRSVGTRRRLRCCSVRRGMADDATVAQRAYDRIGISGALCRDSRGSRSGHPAFAGEAGVLRLVVRDASRGRLCSAECERRPPAIPLPALPHRHGYLSTSMSPALSAIVLSRTPRLQSRWLHQLPPNGRLDEKLAQRSHRACRARDGRGRAVDGEGVLGLPYALFIAGNRNAVITLWKVAGRQRRASSLPASYARSQRGVNVADAAGEGRSASLRAIPDMPIRCMGGVRAVRQLTRARVRGCCPQLAFCLSLMESID